MADHQRTKVSDIMDSTMLPDPTIPVPFEKFAALKDSPDILVRASFWCFYAAWLMSHRDASQVSVALGVEARHDGHQLSVITHELAIRDAVLVPRHDMAVLTQESQDNIYRPAGTLVATYVGMAFVLGIVVTLCIVVTLW
jgi:hypothetical protein